MKKIWVIYRDAMRSLFYSISTYVVMGAFLLLCGLLLWVSEGSYNLVEAGWADLTPFFTLCPWLLMFALPALCVRVLAEQKQNGTFALLLSAPLRRSDIILGKYGAVKAVALLMLLPTLLYGWTLACYTQGGLDVPGVVASYIALAFVAVTFSAIGIFASAVASRGMTAFVAGTLLCLLLYYGFEGVGRYGLFGAGDYAVQRMGMYAHFTALARGLIDTSDLVYFISLCVFFLLCAMEVIRGGDSQRKSGRKKAIRIAIYFVCLIAVNLIAQKWWYSWDVTSDKRYSLSQKTRETIDGIDSPVLIRVYLQGDFPAPFRRLKEQTEFWLETARRINPKLDYVFVDPLEASSDQEREKQLAYLYQGGLIPAEVTLERRGETKILRIFPWAEIFYKDRIIPVSLLCEAGGALDDAALGRAADGLEYAFSRPLASALSPTRKRIAFTQGHGEPTRERLWGIMQELSRLYEINIMDFSQTGDFTPEQVLDALRGFDMLVLAGPQEPFSDRDKYLLDQFVMGGGKLLCFLDENDAQTSSMMRDGQMIVLPSQLNLTDLLFAYGVRVNKNVVSSPYCATLKLALGDLGTHVDYTDIPWVYYPLGMVDQDIPVGKNVDAVWTQYPSQIDTLALAGIRKTALLRTSDKAREQKPPLELNLRLLEQAPPVEIFDRKDLMMGVMLEGEFSSAYASRVKPVKLKNALIKGISTRMAVFSDADIVLNQLYDGRPVPLGFDAWTGRRFGNTALVSGVVDYLLEGDDFIGMRSKTVELRLLDRPAMQKNIWIIILTDILFPVALVSLTGVSVGFCRWRYAKKRRE